MKIEKKYKQKVFYSNSIENLHRHKKLQLMLSHDEEKSSFLSLYKMHKFYLFILIFLLCLSLFVTLFLSLLQNAFKSLNLKIKLFFFCFFASQLPFVYNYKTIFMISHYFLSLCSSMVVADDDNFSSRCVRMSNLNILWNISIAAIM